VYAAARQVHELDADPELAESELDADSELSEAELDADRDAGVDELDADRDVGVEERGGCVLVSVAAPYQLRTHCSFSFRGKEKEPKRKA